MSDQYEILEPGGSRRREGSVAFRDFCPMIAVVFALACVSGVGCLERGAVCASGRVCPVGSQCAAAQDVCIRDVCGNGVVDRGEQCDDGNIESGDGCSPGCRPELAVGGAHTCALVDPSTLRCWGTGSRGQLGRGHRSTIGDDEPGLGGGVHIGGKVTNLAAGGSHSCAVMEMGRLRCWGDCYAGELGYGCTTNIGDDEHPASAGDVDVGGPVSQVVAGSRHTCALLDHGAVRCWGDGNHGRLGYGNTDAIGSPSSVEDVNVGGPVIQLAAGAWHTCALLGTGAVRCWGNGESGKLGYGRALPEDHHVGDDEEPASFDEVDVGGRVRQLVAGQEFTCALMETDGVRCWGEGYTGLLGYWNEDGITNDIGYYEPPSSVGEVEIGDRVDQLAAGSSHTCALTRRGTVRCWGDGGNGRLGYGNKDYIGDDEPPSAAGEVDIGGRAVQLTAGGDHTCALLDTGRVRCWGAGSEGRLGYGSETSIGDDEVPALAGDVDLSGRAIQVTAGSCHTCAVMESGAVRCWGCGGSGTLGYGNTVTVGDNEPPGLRHGLELRDDIAQISAGFAHTCALLAAGGVRCWGEASSGQLGYGTRRDVGGDGDPRLAGNVSLGAPVKHLAIGEAHTCALMHTGDVRCWGANQHGQLGHGHAETIGAYETPDAVDPLEFSRPAAQIVAGARHTCALMDNGDVYCWGSNDHGQLGHGTFGPIILGDAQHPAAIGAVDVGGHAVQITAGTMHTCALLDSGDVRCWGLGDAGQLGHGDTETIGDDEDPGDVAVVSVGGRVRQITAGDGHTCALLDGGAVRCWGSGADGRLGLGDTETIGDDETPDIAGDVPLPGPAGAIAAGAAHTCAKLTTGAIHCWGSGADGRLGHGNTDNIGDDETPDMAGPVPSW